MIDGIAYGLSQLGYVLIVACILAGTFKAFRLHGRVKVILIGIATLAIGLMLINRGPLFGV